MVLHTPCKKINRFEQQVRPTLRTGERNQVADVTEAKTNLLPSMTRKISIQAYFKL